MTPAADDAMQPTLLADWLSDGVWHEPPTAAGILSFTPVIMRPRVARYLSQSEPLMLQHSSSRQQQSHFERLLGNPHYGRGAHGHAHGLLSDSHQQMVRSQSTLLLAPTPPLPLSAPSSLRQQQPPEPDADGDHMTVTMPEAEVAAASAALTSFITFMKDEGPQQCQQQQQQCQQHKYSAAVAAAAVAMAAVVAAAEAAAAAVAVLPMCGLPPLMQEMQVTRPARPRVCRGVKVHDNLIT